MSGALVPGSFDPIHNGHLDVIARVATQFDQVIVTVVVNPNKTGLFSIAERVEMLTDATAGLDGVRVATWQGLLVDFARECGATAMVKGLRNAADFDYEVQMAQMNRRLTGVDTVFLATDPMHSALSSSLIKEIARLGGDVTSMVPTAVHDRLMTRLAEA
ncbi:MAG: pantetheine-phosphate adenylyltransferase [Rhodococcus sp. (in: high G+C Gram-positive bacteria)]